MCDEQLPTVQFYISYVWQLLTAAVDGVVIKHTVKGNKSVVTRARNNRTRRVLTLTLH